MQFHSLLLIIGKSCEKSKKCNVVLGKQAHSQVERQK